MFEAQFAQLEKAIPGLRAVSVVGDDGIVVEGHVKDDLPHDVLSAEMNGILRNLERLRSELGLGSLRELVLRMATQNILLFTLTQGLFILLVTEPTEATGRARYEVQRIAHGFVEILG